MDQPPLDTEPGSILILRNVESVTCKDFDLADYQWPIHGPIMVYMPNNSYKGGDFFAGLIAGIGLGFVATLALIALTGVMHQ